MALQAATKVSRRARMVADLPPRRPWLVVAGWLIVTAAFALSVPTLERVIEREPMSFLPATAPAVQAFHRMDQAFGSGRASSLAYVVLTRHGRLTAADDRYYRALVERLHRRPSSVAETQDWVHTPALRKVLVSHDQQASYVPVGLTAAPGSAQASRQVAWLRQTAREGLPAGLTINVTGDVSTVSDFFSAVQGAAAKTTVIGVALVTLILLVVYRRALTILIPLATIGVALECSRAVVALLGEHGLPVSTFTPTFLTAIVLGAGVDYSVFLIARHHHGMRDGLAPRDAAVAGLRNLRGVLIASAATVAIGASCMALASLSLFRSTGPPLAVGIVVTLAVATTLTPALLTVLGHRVGPRPGTGTVGRGWQRVSEFVITRPGRALAAGLIPLLALAALYPTISPSFDETGNQPAHDDSALGYRALAAHYPPGTVVPDYLILTTSHDLRNPANLAALDAATTAVSKVPGVADARSLTEPLGRPLSQATLAGLSAKVADRLRGANRKVAAGGDGAHRLSSGAQRLNAGALALEAGLARAVSGTGRLSAGLRTAANRAPVAVDAADSAGNGAARLRHGATTLAGALRSLHDGAEQAVKGLRLAHTELLADPLCTADPVCSRVRAGIGEIYRAERDRLAPGLAQAARGAQRIAHGNGELAAGISRLRHGLERARTGLNRLAVGSHRLHAGVSAAHRGATRLARGSGAIAHGANAATTDTSALHAGLDTAATYLAKASRASTTAGAAGFYLPKRALNLPAFAAARQLFLSPDGHTARILVYSGRSPFSQEAMHRLTAEHRAAVMALRGTPLAGADVAATGTAGIDRDIASLSSSDFALVALAVLGAVLLVLMVLLRAIVAPLYLLASVAVSFAAAMGLAALVFQHMLGDPLDWSVRAITFIILVAVGADYNILLMSRIREAAHGDTRVGVARALGATGKLITTAGLIFAGSFAALLAGGLLNVMQTGFAIAAGLLLDTFIVRSLVVPSLTVLFGERAWWPRTARAPAAGSSG